MKTQPPWRPLCVVLLVIACCPSGREASVAERWHAHNDRATSEPRAIRQDFGYSPSRNACRGDVNGLLAAINHKPTFTCIRAERELQRLLSGDCALPVGVCARLDGGTLQLRAILFRESSTRAAQAAASGPASEPESVAAEVFSRRQQPSGSGGQSVALDSFA